MPNWIGGFIPIALVAPLVPMDWHQPFSVPTRDQAYEVVSNITTFGVPPDNGNLDKWYSPWAEPVRVKLGLAARYQQTLAWSGFTPTETNTEDKWHQPWSLPVRDAAFEVIASVTTFGVPPDNGNLDKWHRPLSEPTRQKTTPANQQSLAWSGFTPAPTVTGWHQPWPTPAKRKLVQVDSNVFVVTQVDTYGWRQPLSEPIRKPSLRTASQEDYFAPAFTPAAENIFEDKWHQPWSEPTRRKTTPANQQALAWSGFTPAATFTEDQWHQPWVDPVRRRGFAVQYQQFTAFVQAAPFNETILEPEWHYAWSTPVRLKPGLPVALQQQPAWSGFTPGAIFEDKWHQPWATPTRRKASAANQQALVWSGFTPTGEVVTLDKWYAAWREPVRDKAFEVVSDINVFVAIATPAPSFAWFNSLNEPPKAKRGIGASRQQALAWVPFRENVTEDKWHQPWSEPVRRKSPLRTAPETAMVPFATPYAVVSFGWNVSQNDLAPRRKPGLEARYQQVSAFHPYPVLSTTTAVMAAIETPDILYTDGILYNPPSGALVGVIEMSTASVPTAVVGSIELSTDLVPTAIVSIRQR